jgi:hypothetical protein
MKAAECPVRSRAFEQNYVTLFAGGMASWEGVEKSESPQGGGAIGRLVAGLKRVLKKSARRAKPVPQGLKRLRKNAGSVLGKKARG